MLEVHGPCKAIADTAPAKRIIWQTADGQRSRDHLKCRHMGQIEDDIRKLNRPRHNPGCGANHNDYDDNY